MWPPTDVPDNELFFIKTPNHDLACCAQANDPKSKQWGILVHGTLSHRNSRLFQTLRKHSPLNLIAFDIRGHGQSGGDPQQWSMGFYERDVEDLRYVVEAVRDHGLEVELILGHSRGAVVAMMYAYTYDDVPYYVTLAGRFDQTKGLLKFLTPDDLEKLKRGEIEDAPCLVEAPDGLERRIVRSDLMSRLGIDLSPLRSVKNVKHMWFIHGSKDSVVDVEEVNDFDQLDLPHTTHVMPDADHFMRSPHCKKGFECLYEWMNEKVFGKILKERPLE